MKATDRFEPAKHLTRLPILVSAVLLAGPALGASRPAAPAGAELRAVGADVSCLSVRSRPSYRAPEIDCLETGSAVSVTDEKGAWSRVATADDAPGWVSSRLLVATRAQRPTASAESGTAEGSPAAMPAPEETAAPSRAAPLPVPATPAVMAGQEESGPSDEPVRQTPEPAAPAATVEPEGEAPEPGAEPAVETVVAETLPAAAVAEPAPVAAAVESDPPADSPRPAEDLARALEAELAAARAARDAAEAEASSLRARVQELTEERDDLARRLERAEAQLLFVVSDLEKTRAELMRLKGIPPRLVLPKPEPRPAPPAPAPAPAEAPEPKAPEPVMAREQLSLEAVVGTVRAWAQAWADQRVDDYLAFYSDSFTPADGMSREAWRALRRERLTSPGSIQITLDRINPILQGDRAAVTFVQSYASDTFSDTVTKTLVLERAADGTWQIVEERAE